MPELPEVERFRQTLLNLVSNEARLQIHLPRNNDTNTNPPRVWLSTTEIDSLHDAYHCTDVLRKGKQLAMVLQKSNSTTGTYNDVATTTTTTKNIMAKKKNNESSSSEPPPKQQKTVLYLFLHMGMTGSIRTPGRKICLGHGGKLEQNEKEETEEECYPPPFAYLTFECAGYKAAFCDPRKFGKSVLMDNTTALDELAPDAWLCTDHEEQQNIVLPKLMNQSMGIKGVLLDQKRACSGVGNWVADEVLYQCQIHPDQAYLTELQAMELWKKLQLILDTAVDCLTKNVPYPNDWLFQYRWTKNSKKAGNNSKDALGRSITFLKSGGRTSAIIATMQKLYKSKGKKSISSSSSSSSSPRSTKSTGKQQQQKEEAISTSARTTNSADHEDAQGAIVSKKRKVENGSSPKATSKMAAVVSSTTTTGNESQQSRRRRSPRFVIH